MTISFALTLCKSLGEWSLYRVSTPSWFQPIIDSNQKLAGVNDWLKPDTKDTRHGQAGEAATFCRPKKQRNGDSLAHSPLRCAQTLLAIPRIFVYG